MLCAVALAPNAGGALLEGGAVRKGDFRRTPGGVPRTMRAGPAGCAVLDVFAPPREARRKPGSGFGA